MEDAWRHGLMKNIDPKKYPKSASALWRDAEPQMSVKQLKRMAIAMASNGHEFAHEI